MAVLFFGSAAASAQSAPGGGWLGVGIRPASGGVAVTEVIDGTPAESAGLKKGDVITAVDKTPVRDPRELIEQISRRSPGARVTLSVRRAFRSLSLATTLDRKIPPAEVLDRRLRDKPAPNFELPIATAAGIDPKRKVKLSSLRGKVVVIEVWASWCQFCAQTHQALAALQKKHSRQDLVVLGISVDGAVTDLQRYLRRRAVGFTVLHDNGTVKSAYHADVLPTLIVVDPQGVIRYVGTGAGPNTGHAVRTADGCVTSRRRP